MRIFAISDIHVDYVANKQWVSNISISDYRNDVLILGGDISDSIPLLVWCLNTLVTRFAKVLYVPGNHDLWVFRERGERTSMDKFHQLQDVVESCGASMQPFHYKGVSVLPLLGWYDYSFGQPSKELTEIWMDYCACHWPANYEMTDVTEYFLGLNQRTLNTVNDTIITFSHFLPRIDLMPGYIPQRKRLLYPILGSKRLEGQIRRVRPIIHIYGHSHVNRCVTIEGISYINNAFGYPQEEAVTARRLICVYEC